MQISTPPAAALNSYNQAQSQQNGVLAVAALDARAPTNAPVQTENAVRPAPKPLEGRDAGGESNKSKLSLDDIAPDEKPASTARGQFVDFKA